MRNSARGLLVVGFLAVAGFAFYSGKRAATVTPVAADEPPTPAVAESPRGSSTPAQGAELQVASHDPVDASDAEVELTPEFDALLTKDVNLSTWHAKLERQPRDPVWAAETDESYRRFFLSDPNFAKFGVNPEVVCRTSICEVRLVAYGAEKSTNWNQVLDTATLENHSLPAKAFPGIAPWDEQDGQTAVYYLIMFRNRPDSNADFPRGFTEAP